MPGRGCQEHPPGGPTETLLEQLGRHGQRPAHIHFFVSAPGYRHLTTQLNIVWDPLLYDDFAFATREGLIAEVARHREPEELLRRGLDTPYAEFDFDFVLHESVAALPDALVDRERAVGSPPEASPDAAHP